MKGTLATSGSLPSKLQEARHRGDAVDHAFVHADVDDVGAVLDLLARDADGFFVFAFLDELGELRRAGDVGALADHDEDARLLREGLRAGETERLPSLLGCGIFRGYAATSRAGQFARSLPSSALAMAAMCSGVLPQQPPAMLIRPPCAKFAEIAGHVRRSEIEAGLRERIGQAGVGVARDGDVRLL